MNEPQQIELAQTQRRLDIVMQLAEKMTNDTCSEVIENIADTILLLTNRITNIKNGE